MRTTPVLAGLALLSLPGVALANGNGSLGQSYAANLPGGGIVSEGGGLRTAISSTGAQPKSIAISGIPSGAVVEEAFLYVVFITRSNTTYDSTWTLAGRSVSGTRIGYHDGTCWGYGNNVTLRADVSSIVTGNGTYSLSGVNSNTTYQPQGASLVVVYKDVTSSSTTRVMIRDGTISGNSTGETMSTTFSGFTVPSTPSRATFHMAMGDGQSYGDGAVSFNGATVIPANSFNGSDGGGWDDRTVNVTSRIPSGDTSFPVSGSITSDCLVWPYAAATYTTCTPRTWYRDADGDTWGGTTTTTSCSAPTGYVSRGGDCNDSNSAINPGATEGVGDEVDQNCDLRELCYVDADDDSWRLNTTVVSADIDCRDSGEALATDPTLDCDDADPDTYPGATEIIADGKDQSCDGKEVCYIDYDEDGYRIDSTLTSADDDCDDPGEALATVPRVDCDDSDPFTYPGATEVIGDEKDQSCDGREICWVDEDDDGYHIDSTVVSSDEDCSDSGEAAAGEPDDDCDDTDATINPGAIEIPYDGIDQDCDGDDLCDVDLDGYDAGSGSCRGTDCDDTNADVNPGADEIWYDGDDQDCDGWSDYDADYDGYDSADYGGDDCDDTDDEINPGVDEIWYDGFDQDCDGWSDYDQDKDGYDSDEYGGEDCDDEDDTVHPDAPELDDGIDNDCNGVSEDDDTDGDGITDEDELDIGTDPEDPDSDGDGLLDGEEMGDDLTRDSDGDGSIDAMDTDDDGDGILTRDEVGDDPEFPRDSDGDGTPDHLDLDSDDDTYPDGVEGQVDSDADGTPDYLDLDSDNDSVLDVDELDEDTDGDGSDNRVDPDDDDDGFPTVVEEGWENPDIDGDGIRNYLDPDSDGDGVDDIDEGGGDKDCDGTINVIDADDADGPCAVADNLTYQGGGCAGGASTTGAPALPGALLLAGLALLGLRRRRQ